MVQIEGHRGLRICTILDTNFHEKAHFVKADLATPRGRAQRLCVLRALCFHPL
jgi:hypothetical protein